MAEVTGLDSLSAKLIKIQLGNIIVSCLSNRLLVIIHLRQTCFAGNDLGVEIGKPETYKESFVNLIHLIFYP